MAYRSAFFDSVAGDRLYSADRWAELFDAIQTQGYIPGEGSEMAVVESSPPAMTTRISPGAGFVQGRFIAVTSFHTITHDAAHATLYRKDLVILRVDLDSGVRDLLPTVLKGANAATAGAAVVPTLTQNSTTWEVGLAEVLVAPLDTAIQNSEITDQRAALWGRSSYPDLTLHKAAATLDHPDGSVTNAKIAANTISGDSKMVVSSITGNGAGSAIGTNSVDVNRLTASMDATQFARILGGNAVVATAHIIDGAVTAAKIGLVSWAVNTGTIVVSVHNANATPGYSFGALNAAASGWDMLVSHAGTSFSQPVTVGGDTLTTTTAMNTAISTATAGVASVPLGGIIAFPTAAEITAAGARWARYTTADGLMLVGAGTSGGLTYTENTGYGSTWTPAAGLSANAFTTNDASSGNYALAAGGGGGGSFNASQLTHTHTTPTPTLNGTTATWSPPMRCVVWGRRIS